PESLTPRPDISSTHDLTAIIMAASSSAVTSADSFTQNISMYFMGIPMLLRPGNTATVIDARSASQAMKFGLKGCGAQSGDALTHHEHTWAARRGEGLANPETARRMFISRRTVQFHVSNILAKLGLSSRGRTATLVTRRAG